jgi:hypothetical protein
MKNLLFRLDANKSNRKKTIDFVYSTDKQIKSDENLSKAKLGMTESFNQIMTIFNFSKTKTMYKMNNIMTEPFQMIDRAI